MSNVLSIKGLSKKYGSIIALDHLDLEVEDGQVWGILGPNGSGKTTTLGIILGILHANAGTYSWFEGQYGPDHRKHIGAILETPNFYPYLNALENLKIIQHIKQSYDDPLDDYLDLVKLSHRKKSAFRTYSLGMKQLLAIASTLIGAPEVLIFDEPTNGLDPAGIVDIRNTLLEIASMGKTIIMASHILDEVEKICSHVAILMQGHLLKAGRVGNILTENVFIEVGAPDLNILRKQLETVPGVIRVTEKSGKLELEVTPGTSTAKINEVAFRQGITLTHLQEKANRLEDEFLTLIAQNG